MKGLYRELVKELAVERIVNHPGRPTIIFLHDSLGCIQLWRDFPQQLGELINCNVLIYDRQGYGNSRPFTYSHRTPDYMEWEADILIELMTGYGIDNPILFGHSDGGSIALIAAGKYPDKIRGIITEGAHIFVEDITIKGIKDAIELYQTTDLKTKLQKYHGTKTDDMFWAWAGTWTKEAFRDWNIEHFLPHIQCPLLIIQGEKDEYGTLNQVERIIQQTSGSAIKLVIPGVHHTPHKELPQRVLEKSAAFINDIIEMKS